MQFSDKKGCKTGSCALLCFKETSESAQRAWNGIRVGTHGERLDFKVRPGMGVVDIGYREEIREYEHGTEKREYRLERKIYLHSDRDFTKITGKVDPRAPVMSVAFQIGATEMHTPVIENQDFCDEIAEAGVKVVMLSANGKPHKEPEKPVETKISIEPPKLVKKKGGRPKGSKNKPKGNGKK